MDAREFKVTEVLSRNERFIVPLYQRQYQWHDEYDGGRTKAFWLDVAAKAADVLERKAKFDHYMGALLLAPDYSQRAFGMTPVSHIVDGQQRLTTILLLLSAFRQVALGLKLPQLAEQCDQFLFNRPGAADTDDLVKYKLTPTPADRETFIDILEESMSNVREKYSGQGLYWGSGVPKNTPRRSLRAYEFFIAQVNEFAANGPGDETEIDIDKENDEAVIADERDDTSRAQERLAALLEAVVFHMKLIVITLGQDDDAQVIFETLNSAGQPLLAMDLVRNNIFHRADAQFQGDKNSRTRTERLYREVWEPFDDSWWRTAAPNARPTRPRIDHFLANTLTAETGERTTVRELYAEYRNWAAPSRRSRFDSVEDELAVLQRYAPAYEGLEGKENRDPVMIWLGERLRVWQNTTAYPVAFLVGAAPIDEKTRHGVASLIDSYLTRRALSDLTPKNLNQIFPRLAKHLRDEQISIEAIRRFFSGMTGHTTRFPNDAELRSAILEKQAYGRIPSRILSDILWKLEESTRTRMTESTARPQSLWIEHIIPQTWQESWKLTDPDSGSEIGTNDPRYWERDAAVHRLGNLTIVTDSLNRSLSNLPFAQKKVKLVEHSNLSLNRRIAENEDWNEEKVRERGETLAALCIKMWPSPEEIAGST